MQLFLLGSIEGLFALVYEKEKVALVQDMLE
jgi:hypothetical protein